MPGCRFSGVYDDPSLLAYVGVWLAGGLLLLFACCGSLRFTGGLCCVVGWFVPVPPLACCVNSSVFLYLLFLWALFPLGPFFVIGSF